MKKLVFWLAIIPAAVYADGYYKNGIQYLYYNDNNNVIKCKVMELCNIAMVQDDDYVKLILTKQDAWVDSAKLKNRYTDKSGAVHMVLQAVSADSDNVTLLVGKDYQYSFKLAASEKDVKTNNYQFIKHKDEVDRDDTIEDAGVSYNLAGKTLYRNYTLTGDVDYPYKPIDVFNDGTYTYFKFESSIDRGLIPNLYLYDRNKELNRATGVTYQDHMYIISSVEDRYALVLGSPTSQDSYKIYIKRSIPKKTGFLNWIMEQHAD